ncbi:MAG: hypothetical protein D3926_13395 [Desulfobacteraceae bacterium]|nr:MAG: hypothetical protein D3926_13395 [Desulfobacteraceae bacterium]
MKYPNDNTALDLIFSNGSAPSIEEFTGEYWVNMLTGMIPNFRWAGHRKRFFSENGNTIGKNIILSNITFGHFKVEWGQCSDLNDLEVIVLNYGNKKNLMTRPVRDKIRRIEHGQYLGRYYNVIKGTYRFKGYFSLEKR